MLKLANLKPTSGSRRRKKRVGCGEGSGHGKTSGRGHKGQKARSGGSVRLGFEGGQMPLLRKMPKRGFNNTAFKRVWGTVNLRELEGLEAGIVVDETFLREMGLVRGVVDGIKILGDGDVSTALIIRVDAVSSGARAKIEQRGGRIELSMNSAKAE